MSETERSDLAGVLTPCQVGTERKEGHTLRKVGHLGLEESRYHGAEAEVL